MNEFLRRIICTLLIIFLLGACASRNIAVDVEQTLHNSLRAFRTQMVEKCKDSLLVKPCELIRLMWIEVLDLAIEYDQILLSGGADIDIVNRFRNKIGEFISLLKSIEFSDLVPFLTTAQASIK